MQPREGRVRSGLAGEVHRIEERRRERRCAGEQLGPLVLGQPGEKRLEELPDDTVGERALQV